MYRGCVIASNFPILFFSTTYNMHITSNSCENLFSLNLLFLVICLSLQVRHFLTSKTMSLRFSPTTSQMQRGSSLLMLPIVVRTIRPPGTNSSALHLRNILKSLSNCSKYALNTGGGLVFAMHMFPLFMASLLTNCFGAYIKFFIVTLHT